MSISGISGGFGGYASYFGRQNLQGQNNNNVPSIADSLPASSGLAGGSSGDSELDQLEAFFKEPAAEQMKDLWLMKHGITKAQFDAMSPDQKQKILEQMKQELEKSMKDKAQQQVAKSTNILV